MSTKIHTLTDALGNPLGFHLTPGQACDLDGTDVLLLDLAADALLADKAYDADDIKSVELPSVKNSPCLRVSVSPRQH